MGQASASEAHVISHVGPEWGHANAWVVVVVVCELCCVEQVHPIVLLVAAEHVDVGLNPLVVVLDLSLHLWVVGCGEVLVDVQGLEEPLGVVSCEGGATVCVVDSGGAVMVRWIPYDGFSGSNISLEPGLNLVTY